MSRPLTRIFFLRHGDVLNPRKVLYGYLSYPLSALGKKQIAWSADFLGDKKISAIYTSPIPRCRQTAGIVSRELDVPVRPDRRLIEAKWGKHWQGTPAKIALGKFGQEWQTYLAHPGRLKVYGETMKTMADRLYGFTMETLKRYAGQSVAVVTHGDPLKALILKLERKSYNDLHKIRCRYGCVLEAQFRGTRFKKIIFHSHGSRDLLYLK